MPFMLLNKKKRDNQQKLLTGNKKNYGQSH